MNNELKINEIEVTEPGSVNIELLNKWNTFSKNYINNELLFQVDYSARIKEAGKIFQFSLPPNFDEIFLRYEEAPAYWICDSKLNKYLKDFYAFYYPVRNGSDQLKLIKEYYSKWLLIKLEGEKRYFASTAMSLLEKWGGKNNFLSLILQGTLLIYDNYLPNVQKPIELFNKAREIINSIKINEVYRKELDYLISLFSGYYYLKIKEDDLAKNQFRNSITLKPGGITAKFHLALTEARTNNLPAAENLIREIFDFDIQRIVFAVDNSNLTIFNYFINNSVSDRIFIYKEFAPFGEMLENYITSVRASGSNTINELSSKIETFIQLNKLMNYSHDIAGEILFLEKIASGWNDRSNFLFLNASENIKNKFTGSIELIIESIRQQHSSMIKDKLMPLEKEIQEKSGIVDSVAKELEKNRQEIKSKLETAIKSFEKKITNETSLWEDKIRNLQSEARLNPSTAFNRIMTYNIILSFISSLMGGCAGYSNSSIREVTELKNLFSALLLTGIKWGLITFVIGIVISSLVAGFTFFERSNRRQKILQSISNLKNEKQNTINSLKTEAEKKEKELIRRHSTEIELNKNRIEELLKQKEKEEKELKEEAEKNIKIEIKPLEHLLI